MIAAVIVVGGGGAIWLASLGEDKPKASAAGAKQATSAEDAAQFDKVRAYADDHADKLVESTDAMASAARAYEAIVDRHDGSYEDVAAKDAPAARAALADVRAAFVLANPAYEEMEGIVAGVPSLAQYDVSIDAGSPGSDGGEDVVDFDIVVDDERTLKQPGNFFLVTEATLYGTEPEWSSGVAFDVDDDGSTKEVGDLLPDAKVLSAATRDFAAEAGRLKRDIRAWTPNEDDTFTAIVTMTPTMAEYFTSWKQSRFIAGDKATERGFVAASRLSDVVGILRGIEVMRGAVDARIASVDPAAASAIKQDLTALIDYVDDLRTREEQGTKFTAQQADRYGADAQKQAEAITARVADAARELGVRIAA